MKVYNEGYLARIEYTALERKRRFSVDIHS